MNSYRFTCPGFNLYPPELHCSSHASLSRTPRNNAASHYTFSRDRLTKRAGTFVSASSQVCLVRRLARSLPTVARLAPDISPIFPAGNTTTGPRGLRPAGHILPRYLFGQGTSSGVSRFQLETQERASSNRGWRCIISKLVAVSGEYISKTNNKTRGNLALGGGDVHRWRARTTG